MVNCNMIHNVFIVLITIMLVHGPAGHYIFHDCDISCPENNQPYEKYNHVEDHQEFEECPWISILPSISWEIQQDTATELSYEFDLTTTIYSSYYTFDIDYQIPPRSPPV